MPNDRAWDAWWLAAYMDQLAEYEHTQLGPYFERLVARQRARMYS